MKNKMADRIDTDPGLKTEIGLDGLETEIKMIRMNNGEDIIAYVTEKDNYLFIENAFNVVSKIIEGNSVLIFYPWVSLEIVEDSVVCISKDKYIFMIDPKMKVIESYFKMIEEVNAYIIQNEENQDIEEQSNVEISSESIN